MSMVKPKTITLVKFSLFAALEGHITEGRLEALGDQLAEQLRSEDQTLTVAAEYDNVATTGPTEDTDAVLEALTKQFPSETLPVGACPGVKVLGRNGTFKHAHLTRQAESIELWLGTEKERYPLVVFPAKRMATATHCPSCDRVVGSSPNCQTCKEHRLRELVR